MRPVELGREKWTSDNPQLMLVLDVGCGPGEITADVALSEPVAALKEQ